MSKSMEAVELTKQKVLNALLTEKSAPAAAKKAGVAASTVYRFLTEPEFKERLREAHSALFVEVCNRLTTDATEALNRLWDLSESARSEAVRRQSLDSWLSHFLRVREMGDVEERLAEVERLLAETTRNGGNR